MLKLLEPIRDVFHSCFLVLLVLMLHLLFPRECVPVSPWMHHLRASQLDWSVINPLFLKSSVTPPVYCCRSCSVEKHSLFSWVKHLERKPPFLKRLFDGGESLSFSKYFGWVVLLEKHSTPIVEFLSFSKRSKVSALQFYISGNSLQQIMGLNLMVVWVQGIGPIVYRGQHHGHHISAMLLAWMASCASWLLALLPTSQRVIYEYHLCQKMWNISLKDCSGGIF